MAKKEPEPTEKPPKKDHVPAFANEEDLRDEFFVTDANKPRRVYKAHAEAITPGKILKALFGLITLGITWYLFLGPGKATFDQFLNFLEDVSPPKQETPVITEATPSAAQATATPLPTEEPVAFTATPTTSRPVFTATPTGKIEPSATATVTTEASQGLAGCVPALSVTLQDVGKTLCVTGNVLRTDKKPNGFLITLENPKEAFFFISYERTWEIEKGTCVFATGEIKQLGFAPVMILNYKIPLEFCP